MWGHPNDPYHRTSMSTQRAARAGAGRGRDRRRHAARDVPVRDRPCRALLPAAGGRADGFAGADPAQHRLPVQGPRVLLDVAARRARDRRRRVGAILDPLPECPRIKGAQRCASIPTRSTPSRSSRLLAPRPDRRGVGERAVRHRRGTRTRSPLTSLDRMHVGRVLEGAPHQILGAAIVLAAPRRGSPSRARARRADRSGRRECKPPIANALTLRGIINRRWMTSCGKTVVYPPQKDGTHGARPLHRCPSPLGERGRYVDLRLRESASARVTSARCC